MYLLFFSRQPRLPFFDVFTTLILDPRTSRCDVRWPMALSLEYAQKRPLFAKSQTLIDCPWRSQAQFQDLQPRSRRAPHPSESLRFCITGNAAARRTVREQWWGLHSRRVFVRHDVNDAGRGSRVRQIDRANSTFRDRAVVEGRVSQILHRHFSGELRAAGDFQYAIDACGGFADRRLEIIVRRDGTKLRRESARLQCGR